jgi:hypothetical protein
VDSGYGIGRFLAADFTPEAIVKNDSVELRQAEGSVYSAIPRPAPRYDSDLAQSGLYLSAASSSTSSTETLVNDPPDLIRKDPSPSIVHEKAGFEPRDGEQTLRILPFLSLLARLYEGHLLMMYVDHPIPHQSRR